MKRSRIKWNMKIEGETTSGWFWLVITILAVVFLLIREYAPIVMVWLR